MLEYPTAASLSTSWVGASTYSPPTATAIDVGFVDQYYPADRAAWDVAASLSISWVGASVYSPPIATAVDVAWIAYTPTGNEVQVSVPARTVVVTPYAPVATVLGWDGLVGTVQVSLTPYAPTATLTYDLFLPYVWMQSIFYAPTLSTTAKTYKFAPADLVPGYTFSADAITIPLAALPGLSAAEAHATTGDWRAVFQELCLLHQYWFDAIPASTRPQTVHAFMLEDWAKVVSPFGRIVYRAFAFTFITENVPTDIFEPE